MKTKTYILVLFVFSVYLSGNAQQSQPAVPKIENQIIGELDYTNGGFELVQWQKGGDEITLGTIDKEGTIHFTLPEYDIRALPRNNMDYTLESQFQMVNCKGKSEVDITGQPLDKTQYDDVYSQLYAPMFLKKYGVYVAYVSLVSDKKMLIKGNFDKITGNKYYWFYIDRALDYKDNCIKERYEVADLEVDVSADMQFKKGWNFVKRNLVEVQNYGENNEHTIPKKIQFTLSSSESKDVIWQLARKMDEEKILAAKKKYNSATPITKAQFEKWLPIKAADLTRTSYELDKELEDSDSKSNNVFLVFENETQKMEIAILDGAKNPLDLEMAKLSFAMDEQLDRDDKPASDTTVSDATDKGEVHHISKEDKEKKTSELMSVFKDRIVLYAIGKNMTAEQLWETIKTLDVGAIID